MKTLENYLHEQHHTAQTIKSYLYTVSVFLSSHPKADEYKHQDILNYMSDVRKFYPDTYTSNTVLAGIKKYYDYLIEIGKRNFHPCKTLYLKSKRTRDIIHQDLFSSKELEILMEREERYADNKLRNQTIVSLLIYQGLSVSEIIHLKTEHINLENGIIFIKESKQHSQRHLEIHPKQFNLLYRLIHEVKREAQVQTVLTGSTGKPLNNEHFNYLIFTYKPLFPDRNLNTKTIRQSVIANWLNEKKIPLEQVQLLAGHRWTSSTERYKQNNLNEQRTLINKWFPLN
ncbi:MAG: tyrosine-type recombinase/integrase [Bacteroidia bacterium]